MNTHGETAYPDPGQCNALNCGICHEPMSVIRDCYGPTCYTDAMSGKSRSYDRFSCSYKDEDWHIQARQLTQAINDSPSQVIAELMETELKQVLTSRQATKKVFKFKQESA